MIDRAGTAAEVFDEGFVVMDGRTGEDFFGEPEFEPSDLLRLVDGKGVVTLLELADQAANPRLFSTFLMWLLAELYEELPEAGDLDKPKLVFFFDEAHLLFKDASKAFLERIEQTVKLIRSKGVGVFFCTQLPTDVPNAVLSQLGAHLTVDGGVGDEACSPLEHAVVDEALRFRRCARQVPLKLALQARDRRPLWVPDLDSRLLSRGRPGQPVEPALLHERQLGVLEEQAGHQRFGAQPLDPGVEAGFPFSGEGVARVRLAGGQRGAGVVQRVLQHVLRAYQALRLGQ